MITFENPALLFLLWVVLFQALLLWVYWRWRKHTLRRLGSPALAQRLLLGFSGRRFWLKNILFGLALALLVGAIANPRQLVKREAEERQGADIVLALDISQSMLAKDVSPSRLEQAKTFARQLITALDGNRIGLLFFAGEAYPQMPLSTDYEALMTFVYNAGPEFIADQGTAAGPAIELAGRMFESNSTAGRGLVLISDGENHTENALQRAQEARQAGLSVYTVAVGSTAGTTIPLASGGQKRDGLGRVVRTQANPALLTDLARAGGGASFKADGGRSAVAALAQELGRLQKAAVAARAHSEYLVYFQWLLLPCLLLLIAEQILWWRKKNTGAA